MTIFSSEILLPFPKLNDLNSRDSFHLTQVTDKTYNFPSKIGDFQHVPHFRSIPEAP